VLRTVPPAIHAGDPDLVVFAPTGPAPPDPETSGRAFESGAAVLPVTIRETTVIVGPLHAPESIATAGCPRCVHQHRVERDPQWPQLVDQHTRGARADAAGTAATALVWAGGAAAASQTLAWLDNRALEASVPALPSAGASLELASGDWDWQRRWWGPHPDCRCRRATIHPARVAAEGHD
jgi:hypothetical protein